MTELPQGAESVAYALMKDIALAEAPAPNARSMTQDRKWILDTFAECLKCVRAEPVKAAPSHGRSSF